MTARRLLLLLLLLFGLSGLGVAQGGKSFRGFVFDSLSKTPLEACTVVLREKTAVKAVTNDKGFFFLAAKTDTALLQFYYTGYRNKQVRFVAQCSDTVWLAPADKLLDGIVVKAKLPPVVVRGDTTEFNIDSSMFESFDVVEDLVKRLPGVEVTEGGLRYQGKPIDRIFVDGEPLFDETGSFAMKKVPAGMVAKIQVMDTKTLEQVFAGVPADGNTKTLNIKLREGNKSFASAEGGTGTRNQTVATGSATRMQGSGRLTFSGGYNSSNRGGLFKTTEGPSSAASNAGLSYADKFGPVRISAGYAYTTGNNANDYLRQRTQLITVDTSIFTRSASRFAGQNNSHRFSLSAVVQLDSSTTLDLALGYNRSANESRNQASSLTAENGVLRNESLNESFSTRRAEDWNARLSFRKWLNRKGRSLAVNARTNTVQNESELFSNFTNVFFQNGSVVDGDTLDRRTTESGNNRSYGVNLSYTEPLTKTLRFSVNANLDAIRSRSSRAQYNLDTLTKAAVLDTAFSAGIFSAAQTKTLGASLMGGSWQSLYVSAGFNTVWQTVERTVQKQVLRQTLLRHAPTLTVSYAVSKQKNLRASFSAATLQPTLEQIQPVPDNSNPLYVRLGNPSLRTAFAQNYAVSYDQNGVASSFSVNAGYSPVSNQIVSATTYDAFRRATAQYVNVDGTFTGRASLHYSRSFRRGERTTVWTASSGASLGEQAYFQPGGRYLLRNEAVNGALSVAQSRQSVRSPGFELSLAASQSRNYTPEDLTVLNTTRLNLTPALEAQITAGPLYAIVTYNLAYNQLRYGSAKRRDDAFVLHGTSANLRQQLSKKVFLQFNLNYQYNTEVPEGAPKGQFNSTASATAQLAKDRFRAVLTVHDLFATANRLQRTTGDNYIEDLQSPVLRNYVVLRLQGSFSKLQRKNEKK